MTVRWHEAKLNTGVTFATQTHSNQLRKRDCHRKISDNWVSVLEPGFHHEERPHSTETLIRDSVPWTHPKWLFTCTQSRSGLLSQRR